MTTIHEPAQSASEARGAKSNQADSGSTDLTSEAADQQPIYTEVVFTRNGNDDLTVINRLAKKEARPLDAKEVSFQRVADFARSKPNEYHLVEKGETYELRGYTIAEHDIALFCWYKQLVLDTTPDSLACDDREDGQEPM